MQLTEFYKNKKVLITGHTGFKGTWLCLLLHHLGAEVIGYALDAPTTPSLYCLSGIDKHITSVLGDIRDFDSLHQTFLTYRPEVVIHMAAQPLVRESYQNPAYTYDVNVMGTVNVMECVRITDFVKSVVNVTTDKVYHNKEWEWGYRENEELNGWDPYSNSKSCSEMVTDSYRKSFFGHRDVQIFTARAGNVIGGGDFAADRIIPDCVRAIEQGSDIIVRNQYSIRPYQHVLEPLWVYLTLASKQNIAGAYNVGPEEADCLTTGALVGLFCEKWNTASNRKVSWINQTEDGPHEAGYLRLDCAKVKQVLNWHPHWNIEQTMEKIIEWSCIYMEQGDIIECMNRQIAEFISEDNI